MKWNKGSFPADKDAIKHVLAVQDVVSFDRANVLQRRLISLGLLVLVRRRIRSDLPVIADGLGGTYKHAC